MNPIRTPMAAVVLSTFALGLSCWAIACGTASAPSAAPAPPCTAPAAPATAAPPALASASAQPAQPQPPSASVEPIPQSDKSSSRSALAKADLRIKRLVLSRSIKQREPVVALSQVAAGTDPLYAFVEVENRSAYEGAIVISFEKEGTRTGNIELNVPANQARWRTWGFSRGVREPGEWSVVVRSAGGRELARTAFEAS